MFRLPRALQQPGVIAPLALLVLIMCGVWFFAVLMSEVIEGDTQTFDQAVLLALREPGNPALPIGPPAVQEFMRDVSGLGGVGIMTLVTTCAVIFLTILGNFRSAVFVMISVVTGSLISMGFKILVDRPRPDLVPHGSFVSTASFPSGHSMMSAVVYLTLAVMLARTTERLRLRLFFLTVAVVLTLGVGVSRVYLGVHWPTDVVAGWVLGASWAISCAMAASWLGRTGKIETELPVKRV